MPFYNLLLYFLVSNTSAFSDFVPKIIVTEATESGLKNNASDYLPEDKVLNETSCTGILEQGGMVLCKTITQYGS